MSDDLPSLFDLPASHRVEPARLTQARLLSGKSKTELAADAGVSAAAIGQYEAGVNSPRPEVLARIADSLDMRPEFFATGRPLVRIDDLNAHFRSLRSAKVSDRQLSLATAAQVWELTFALERYVRLPEPNLPEIEAGASPAEAAAALREHWRLPNGPVKHLVATAEANGVVVVVRPVGAIDAVDAFSLVIVDRPIIVTTPRRSENVFRHRFSIAHEVGHILLHRDTELQGHQIEREADEFAAAFLTPAPSMDQVLPNRLDLTALDRIGRTWGVSAESLVLRMVERNRTTESSARRAFQRLRSTFDPTSDPTRAYPGEQPTLLKRASELAAEHGVGVPAIAESLRWKRSLVRDLLGIEDPRPVLRLV